MRLIMMAAAAAILVAPAAHAQRAAPAVQATTPVLLPNAVQFDMASVEAGRTYRIFVFKPSTPPPPKGYPVIVVTDGNGLFPLAAIMSLFEGLSGKTGALVVGVGYPTADFMTPFSLRNRDLTPQTPLSGFRQTPGQPPVNINDYGGSENFYRFLTKELRPAIAAQYQTDSGNQTLYGHSLGGLFALGVLFNHPESFARFVASSPSIWWNTRAVLKDEAGFVAKVKSGQASPRILIMVGGEEQSPPDPAPPGYTHEQLVAMMNDSRMVDNARELGERLKSITAPPPYQVSLHVFEEETHISVIPASLSRAVDFAVKP
jgi:predicted alpha/beta superfamily hydrolase